jgi:hypothetical protein
VWFGRAKGSTTIDTSKCSHSSIRQLLALLTREPPKGPPTSDYLASIYNTPFHYILAIITSDCPIFTVDNSLSLVTPYYHCRQPSLSSDNPLIG